MPLAPPSEVMEAIANAARAYDHLQAGGHQLHFGIDPTTGRMSIQLQDLGGRELSSLKPSQVLAIASGEPE
jgi:hypothetical protein